MRLARDLVLVTVAAAAGALGGRLAAPPAPAAPAAAPAPVIVSRVWTAPPIEAPVDEDGVAPTVAPGAPRPGAHGGLVALEDRLTAAPIDATWAAGAEQAMREALGGAGRLEDVRCGGDTCRFSVAHGDEQTAEMFHDGLGPRFVGAPLHVTRHEQPDGRVLMTVYVEHPRS